MNVNDPKDAHAFLGQVLRDFSATLPQSAQFATLVMGELALKTLKPTEPPADVPPG